MICGECKQNKVACRILFSGKNAVWQFICESCLDRVKVLYKSTWGNSQICLLPVEHTEKPVSRRLGRWVRMKEFFFPCRMKRVVNQLIQDGKIRPRYQWSA